MELLRQLVSVVSTISSTYFSSITGVWGIDEETCFFSQMRWSFGSAKLDWGVFAWVRQDIQQLQTFFFEFSCWGFQDIRTCICHVSVSVVFLSEI